MTAHAFATARPEGVGILELVHNRAPSHCPEEMGMVTVQFLHTPDFPGVELDEQAANRLADRLGQTSLTRANAC